MKKKKVLVLCPHPSGKGGVAFYYGLLRKYFYSERLSLDFYYTGKPNYNNQRFKSISDTIALIKVIKNYDIIVLNPSLDAKAVLRDGIYHALAKRIFSRKTIIFYHGWQSKFEKLIDRYGKRLFKAVFNSDKTIVLSSQFKGVLMQWGIVQNNILLETTVYEEHSYKATKDPHKIIFLSRLVKDKGCIEAIRTIEILSREYPAIRLYIAGDGELLPELQEHISSQDLKNNIEITGWLEGKKKYHLLEQCGIMLYPTYYGEGMPISLLEGMGMGLAVVTRPVAGIPDIVVDGENGFLIESLNPEDFAQKIKLLIQDEGLWKYISDNNRRMAKEKFEIRNVAKRLEKLYIEI